MKYETDKGYLVCKETKNGVIDDLKIEGRTLVNLCPKYIKNSDLWANKTFESDSDGFVTVNANGTWVACPRLIMSSTNVKPNTTYTVILEVKSNTLVSSDNNGLEFSSTSFSEFAFKWNKVIKPKETGTFVHKITSLTNLEGVSQLFRTQIYNTCTEGSIVYRWYLLEGDHTQNPPSYFEGLMSVGEDVDKIEVLSHKEDGNLFDATLATQTKNGVTFSYDDATGEIVLNGTCTTNNTSVTFKNPPKFIKGNTYYLRLFGTTINSPLAYIRVYDDKYVGNNLATTNKAASIHNSSSTRKMVNTSIRVNSGVTFNNFRFKVQLTVNEDRTEYIPRQSDKKQILFYNENGELEPVTELHEWDSIEKHSDNKWYYHKRSGKVVLNGSEDWITTGSADEDTLLFYMKFNAKPCEIYSARKCISDKINSSDIDLGSKNIEGIYTAHDGNICIRISKSKLSSQDVEGFKQWLQTNNVTVVYQLAEEEVYELAPLHLDSYANETLILCNSGAISPKMEFSITSHINELVKAYGERINLLEEKVYKYMVTQNRMQLASTYSADSVTFKVDYFSLCGDEENYNEDLYNLILNNILVGKDNYDYDRMFTMILDYASWNQISWEQFDILVGLMDIQHNPPIEELPPEDVIEEDIIENETPVE